MGFRVLTGLSIRFPLPRLGAVCNEWRSADSAWNCGVLRDPHDL